VRLSPERAGYYVQRLDALLDELLHEQPDPDGKVYGVLMTMFSSPSYIQGSSTSNTENAV
jgi:hypothetical protein